MKNQERKYTVITYGCQMNELDSEKISGQLEEEEWKATEDMENTDLIILNTCCVRAKAEDKVKGKLGELKKLKEKNPALLLGIGGCMMQQEGVGKEFMEKFPYLNFVFGPHTLDRLPDIIEESYHQRVLALEEDKNEVPPLPVKRKSPFRAWVSIIKGCQNFCSYCIVPYVRGREVSRKIEDIVEEVQKQTEEGAKEIVLLGQNVNAYGRDLGQVNFVKLLEEVNKVDGVERIRFMTSHPRDFPLELVDAIASMGKVCEHLHLPIQAGSDRILKKMNRGYTQNKYLQLTEHVRSKIPGASITTDLIVGFPGETEEDFEETLKVVEEVRFDSAFTFAYSPREGTPAASLKEQVPTETKKARLNELIRRQQKISLDHNKKMEGGKVEILVEGPSKKDSEQYMGRTRTNKPVVFAGPAQTGSLVSVEITGANAHTLFAKLG